MEWKNRSKEPLKVIFVTKKKKKAGRGACPLFQNQRCLLFFKEYLKPQVSTSKMVNEQTVYDHPSTSELTSRIYSFIFLRIPKGVYLSRIFLEFFCQTCIPPWLQTCFKFMVLRPLKNKSVNQKIENVHFCSCLKR